MAERLQRSNRNARLRRTARAWLAGMAAAFALLSVAGAHAQSTTSPITPLVGPGGHSEWTPSTGSSHTAVISTACTSNTYLSTTTRGARESIQISPYTLPMGSNITGIEITPCLSSLNGQDSIVQVFYTFNSVDSVDGGAYFLSGMRDMAPLRPYTFTNLDLMRNGTVIISAGVVLKGGTGGARMNGLQVRLIYDQPEPFNAPTNLVAVNLSPYENLITWTDNTTVETSFRVEISTNADDAFTLTYTNLPDDTDYLHDLLASDQTFWYRVQAQSMTTGQNSDWSNVVHATTYLNAPPTPLGVTLTSDSSGIDVSWLDTGNNEDGFVIERSTNGVTFTEIAELPAGTTSYHDDVNPGSGTFHYRVRAQNQVGESSNSTVVSNGSPPTQGPDLQVSMNAVQSSMGATQTTSYTINYSSGGTVAAPNAYLVATIPADTSFLPGSASPEWRCHAQNAEVYKVVGNIGRMLRLLKRNFPNLAQVFISSHHYTGIFEGAIAEPYAYEGGFGVKEAIQAQIDQIRTGIPSPWAGDLDYRTGIVPWIGWAHYQWSNGENRNGQGLFWELADYIFDLTHPSDSGIAKAGGLLRNFMYTSPLTYWSRVSEEDPVPILPIEQPGPNPTAIIDMLPDQYYAGMRGGLYENVSNEMPADHLAAGLDAAARIVPRDTDGNPAPDGKIIYTSIGFSNTGMIFRGFMAEAEASPHTRPLDDDVAAPTDFRILNGAVGGGTMNVWLDPLTGGFTAMSLVLESNHYSEAQIQSLWFHAANNAGPLISQPLQSITPGTECRLPLGTMGIGAMGVKTFALRTTYTAATPVSFSMEIRDDGTAGGDLTPLNNENTLNINVGP